MGPKMHLVKETQSTYLVVLKDKVITNPVFQLFVDFICDSRIRQKCRPRIMQNALLSHWVGYIHSQKKENDIQR